MREQRLLTTARDCIFAAAAGEVEWSAVSHAVAKLVGADTVSLWVGEPIAGEVEIIGTSFGPEVEARYAAYYHRHDLWTQRCAARRAERVFHGTDIVPEPELRHSEGYADFFKGLGMFHLLGAVSPLGAGLGFCVLGLHRPEAAPAFGEAKAAALAAIFPLLRHGLRMRQLLRLATGAAVAAMDGLAHLGSPALVVDADGRILHANDPARAILAAGRGLASQGGRCVASHRGDAASLARLIRAAASAGVGDLLRLRPGEDGVPLVVLAQRPSDAAHANLVLLLLVDASQPASARRVTMLRALHGLTQAEAEVAEAAARGEPAARIAAARGTSEATVRVQLRRTLEKSGYPNLRALSAAVAGLPR